MERSSIAAGVTLPHALAAMSVDPQITAKQRAPELLTVVGPLVMDPDIND